MLILPATSEDRVTDCPYCHAFKAPSTHTADECRRIIRAAVRSARALLEAAEALLEAAEALLDRRIEELEK